MLGHGAHIGQGAAAVGIHLDALGGHAPVHQRRGQFGGLMCGWFVAAHDEAQAWVRRREGRGGLDPLEGDGEGSPGP